MKTKHQLGRTLPLVLLISCFIFLTCEKEVADSDSAYLKDPIELKKKGKCPGSTVDVIGVGNSKKEAEADLEKRALNACYNICKNNICDDGACAFKKAKIGKKESSTNSDDQIEYRAKVECDCVCEDCKGKKNVSQNAFTGSGETKQMAITAAETAAAMFCKSNECPRFPCDSEEACLFKEAKTSKANTNNDGGLWTASVELITCDCNCGEGAPDGTN